MLTSSYLLNANGWKNGITAELSAKSLAGFNADRISAE